MSRPPFPHMMENDVPLFAAFILSDYASLYQRWQFDLHVGQGHLVGPSFDPVDIALALEVTRLRIDAVGWIGSAPSIFEVKPQAGLGALGQVLGYEYFFYKEFQIMPRLGIITDDTTPDLRELYAAKGVNLYIVEPTDLSGIIQACKIVGANCDQFINVPPDPSAGFSEIPLITPEVQYYMGR